MVKFGALIVGLLFVLGGCTDFPRLASEEQLKQRKVYERYLNKHSENIFEMASGGSDAGLLVLIDKRVSEGIMDVPLITTHGRSAVHALGNVLSKDLFVMNADNEISLNDFRLCVFFYKSDVPVEPTFLSCSELLQRVVFRRNIEERMNLVDLELRGLQEAQTDLKHQADVLRERVHAVREEVVQHRTYVDERLSEVNQELEW